MKEKNNQRKVIQIPLLVIIGGLLLTVPIFVSAVSGACSWHEGVDCDRGRQLDGTVYCNDGWTDSIALYDFMVECQNKDYSCTLEEWGGLSQKYELEDIYFQLQDITEKMLSNPLLQIQYNALKDQYDLALSLAERECRALGADRADQQNYERMKLEFYNEQIEIERDKLAQLEEEERKLTEEYLNALNDLNTYTQDVPQYACPANSTLSGDKCICNEGYIAKGGVCITHTENCQSVYGQNVYGKKGNNSSVCSCVEGYKWNSSQTACLVIEIPKEEKSQMEPQLFVKDTATREEGPSAIKEELQSQKEEQQVEQDLQKENEEKMLKQQSEKQEQEQKQKRGITIFLASIFTAIKNFFTQFFR